MTNADSDEGISVNANEIKEFVPTQENGYVVKEEGVFDIETNMLDGKGDRNYTSDELPNDEFLSFQSEHGEFEK